MKYTNALFFCFLPFLLQAQDSIKPSMKIDITYLPTPKDSFLVGFSGGTSGFHFSHRGTLEKGIPVVLGVEEARVKFNKKPPKRFLSFNAFCRNLPAARTLILEELQARFMFNVTDIKDTLDVWVLHKVDEKKLWICTDFDDPYTIKGPWAGDKEEDPDTWESCGFSLHYLVYDIKSYSKRLIFFEEKDEKGYNFEVPFILMRRFDGLSDYLKENYGLELVKERRLMDVKYVQFR